MAAIAPELHQVTGELVTREVHLDGLQSNHSHSDAVTRFSRCFWGSISGRSCVAKSALCSSTAPMHH